MINKLEFAKTIVKEAGSYLREHLHDQLAITVKTNPTDLVTQMDQEVQATLVGKILEAYPEDQIFAEEDELRAPIHSGKVWVIDPIDGTNNFITQRADFAIMLAYFENGQGKFGLIYDVTRDQLFHGGGAFDVYCNDRKLSAFIDKPLQQYLMASNASMLEHNHWGLADLARDCLGVRVYGSAGISFAKTLAGGLAAYFSYNWPWDYAAAEKAVGKDNLGISVYPTVNIGGQDVQQKAFLGVKLYAVNQTPSNGDTDRIAASYKLAQVLTSKESQENQFKFEGRHIIPANKEVQESEDVKKDALAQAVITMGSSDTYTTVMPKLSQMSVFWTESAAILSDAYNGKFGEDQYLAKLQQFDKDLAAAK